MSENENAEELAQRAKEQAKHSAKNSGRALKAAAEPMMAAAADEARDTADKLEGTAQDAVTAARKLNPQVLSRLSGDTGIAFLAVSMSLWSGAIAFNKFRQVLSGRGHVTDA